MDKRTKLEEKLKNIGYKDWNSFYLLDDFIYLYCASQKITIDDFISEFSVSLRKALELQSKVELGTRQFDTFYHILRAIKKTQPELLNKSFFNVNNIKDRLSFGIVCTRDEYIKRKEKGDTLFVNKCLDAAADSWLYLAISSVVYNVSEKQVLYDLVVNELLRFPISTTRTFSLEFLFGIELNQLMFPEFDLEILLDYLPTVKQVKEEYTKYGYNNVISFWICIAKVILCLGNSSQKIKFKEWFKNVIKKLGAREMFHFVEQFFARIILDGVFNPLNRKEIKELEELIDKQDYLKRIKKIRAYLKRENYKPHFDI